MYCRGCRATNDDGSKFCRQCGRALPVPLNAPRTPVLPQRNGDVTCEKCRARSHAASIYCWSCGAVIPEAAAPAEPAPPANSALQLPSDPRELLRFAHLARNRGEIDQAITLARHALDLAPNTPGAREFLGDLYTDRGMARLAAEQYVAALQQVPESLELRRKFAQAVGRPVADAIPRTATHFRPPEDPLAAYTNEPPAPKPWYLGPIALIGAAVILFPLIEWLTYRSFGLYGLAFTGLLWNALMLTGLYLLIKDGDRDGPLWIVLSFVIAGFTGVALYLMTQSNRKSALKPGEKTRYFSA